MSLFLSIGLAIDIPFVINHYSVLTLSFSIIIVNSSISMLAFRFLRHSWSNSFYAGALMAQIGEFSLLINAVAYHSGLMKNGGMEVSTGNHHKPLTLLHILHGMSMNWIETFLGVNDAHLTADHMALRAVIAFILALIYVRVTGLRTLGRQSAFDAITLLMFGAIMGRSIVSDSSFFGSLLAALVLMIMHRITALITCVSHKAGVIIKGKPILLFQNGELLQNQMKRVNITHQDIMEAVRLKISTENLNKVATVYLERSGEISVIEKK